MTTVAAPAGRTTTDGQGTPGPSENEHRVPPARRDGPLVAGLGGLALVVLAVALVAPAGGDDTSAARVLPATLVGLPAQGSGSSDALVQRLTSRLAAEPSVSDVDVRAYGADGRALVVLDLTPRTALTDESAGELTARVLGAAGPQRGMSDDFRSVVTDDGLALVTCSTAAVGASTCVSVEADRALVVLTAGDDGDPVELTSAVRAELVGVDGR